MPLLGVKCTYCLRHLSSSNKSSLALTRDHVVPKSKKEPGQLHTVVLACKLCNGFKGNMMPDEWTRWMTFNPRWWELSKKKRQERLKEFKMLGTRELQALTELREIEVEQQEEKDNVVHLLTGGKGPPTTAGDWLSELVDGTVFYAQNKRDPMDFCLPLFRVARREGRVIFLQSPGQPQEIPVNPVRFCNSYTLYENHGVLFNKEVANGDVSSETGGKDDGDRTEPDQSADEVERSPGEPGIGPKIP